MNPIKIFVGCSPNGEDAESLMVLEHTLLKYASRPVEVIHMHIGAHPLWTGWDTSLWATPFSGFRWTIPEYMGFQGRAIYMDSDMIIRDDIAKLYYQDMRGKSVLAKGGSDSWRFCVALWDCERAKTDTPMGSIPLERAKTMPTYHGRMMNTMSRSVATGQFEGDWNCIDGEDLDVLWDDVGIVHYSSMAHQPHLKYAIPRLARAGQKHWYDGEVEEHWNKDVIKLFDNEYKEAIDLGFKVESYTKRPEDMVKYYKESQKNYRNAHQWVR